MTLTLRPVPPLTQGEPIAYEKARSHIAEEPSMAVAVPYSELASAETLPADQRPQLVYLSRLAPGSRRTMRDALNVLAGMLSGGLLDADGLDWSRLRYQHAQLLRAMLQSRTTRLGRPMSPASVNKHLAALRGVAEEAWRLGLMPSEDQRRIEKLRGVRGVRLVRGRSLAPGELAALASACAGDRSPAGARDAAIIAVLYETGIRRAELVGLDLADYEPESGDLAVRAGKGDKDRLHVGDGAAAALAAWLAIRGDTAGPLFVPVNKGRRLAAHRLTTQAIYNMLRRRGGEAGLRPFSPHDLRRTFVGDQLDAGTDIAIVSQLAGHARMETTLRYDRRPEAARRAASRRLRFPYVAPR